MSEHKRICRKCGRITAQFICCGERTARYNPERYNTRGGKNHVQCYLIT